MTNFEKWKQDLTVDKLIEWLEAYDGCCGCGAEELCNHMEECECCLDIIRKHMESEYVPGKKECKAEVKPDYNWIDNINPYWLRITVLAEKQRRKGVSTYGTGIENNPAEMLERLTMLEEELIDGLMYIEWIKDKIR